MDVMEAIKHRRSVRAFADQPVDKKTLEALVDAALWAPSGFNAQPWHFTVIQNKALLDRISDASKLFMLAAIEGSPDKRAQALHAHLADPHFHVFYHAPAVILISATASDFAAEDAGLAAENLMLAAYAQGLGSCWIGFAQKWLETAEGKKAVELDAAYVPVAPIIVGHASGDAPMVPRNPPHIRWID